MEKEDNNEKWYRAIYWKKEGRIKKLIGVILSCFLNIGGFITFDCIASVQNVLMRDMEMKADDFSLLYSINAWPSIVFCCLGGYFIDRLLGLKVAAIVYSIIISIGHFLLSVGVLLRLFWLMLVGRFILGVGMDTMLICQFCYATKWLQGKELSVCFCVIATLGRLGTAFMFGIAGPIYTYFLEKVPGHQAVSFVFFIVGTSTLMTVAIAIILGIITPQESTDSQPEEAKEPKKDLKPLSLNKLLDVIHYPFAFWLITLIHTVLSTSKYTFIPFSQGFFMERFEMSIEEANRVTSLISIIGAATAPFIGILVDKIGRLVFVISSCVLCEIAAYLLLNFTYLSPYIAMTFLALTFPLMAATLSPMLYFILPETKRGTAFGVKMAMLNGCYSFIMIGAGKILAHYSYYELQIFIISWTVFGQLVAFTLWIVDKKGSGILNMTPAQRLQLEKERTQNDEEKEPLNDKPK